MYLWGARRCFDICLCCAIIKLGQEVPHLNIKIIYLKVITHLILAVIYVRYIYNSY